MFLSSHGLSVIKLSLLYMSLALCLPLPKASAQNPPQEAPAVKRLYLKNAVPIKLPPLPQKQTLLPKAPKVLSKTTLPGRTSHPLTQASSPAAARSSPVSHLGSSTHFIKMPLHGGVSMNVPRTSTDVGKYLKHMRIVIDRYEQVASTTILSSNRSQLDPTTLKAAKDQALDVIQQIRSIVPPAQLTARHNELAGTLLVVADFMENPTSSAKNGMEALANISPLLKQLHGTLEGYHTGVKNCLSYYHLGNEYDPFAGENQNTKAELSNMLSNMKANLLERRSPSASNGQNSSTEGLADSAGGLDLNSLGSLLGSMGNNSSSGASNSGLDPSALGALLGAFGGNSSSSTNGSSIDFSKLGGLEQLGGLAPSSSKNLAGLGLESLNEQSGSCPSSSSDFSTGLKVDPATMEQFGNLLKQFQGQ